MKVSKKGAGVVDSHVGQRVRMRRTLIGMSQERLGELLGLTFQQVQKYEKGMNRIGAGRLFELAGILGVPVTFFYEEFQSGATAGGFAEEDEPPPVMEFLSSGEGLQLSLAFMRIKDMKVRRRIVELIRSVADEREGEAA
jgi:transcriptional regulator with XRE-family HTH domain